MLPIKALFFDMFGTILDWRNSIARETQAILEPRTDSRTESRVDSRTEIARHT